MATVTFFLTLLFPHIIKMRSTKIKVNVTFLTQFPHINMRSTKMKLESALGFFFKK